MRANSRGIGTAWMLVLATLWLAAASASARPLTARSTADALDVSLNYLRSRRVAMGFEAGDLEDVAVTDRYRSKSTGLTHLYLRQRIDGIEVDGAEISMAVDAQGRLVSVGDRFERGLHRRTATRQAGLTAVDAVLAASLHLGLEPDAPLDPLDANGVDTGAFRFPAAGVSRGNNVFAQEDTDADDAGGLRPDGAAGLDFSSLFDPTLQPGNYIDASVTNLFYWNNILHDVLYQYGFDEPAGNFQSNNYGKGGAAGDPVQADSQDGSAIDNAQFGTPPDGFDPRMEMFRWIQLPTPRVIVSSPPAIAGTYSAGYALFGAGTLGLAGNVVQALDPPDGAGPSMTDACSPLTNAGAVPGKIAIIDRGTCTFVVKVGHAEDAGAIGVDHHHPLVVRSTPPIDEFKGHTR